MLEFGQAEHHCAPFERASTYGAHSTAARVRVLVADLNGVTMADLTAELSVTAGGADIFAEPLAWISHAREKISPLVGISESDQTIGGEKP